MENVTFRFTLSIPQSPENKHPRVQAAGNNAQLEEQENSVLSDVRRPRPALQTNPASWVRSTVAPALRPTCISQPPSSPAAAKRQAATVLEEPWEAEHTHFQWLRSSALLRHSALVHPSPGAAGHRDGQECRVTPRPRAGWGHQADRLLRAAEAHALRSVTTACSTRHRWLSP